MTHTAPGKGDVTGATLGPNGHGSKAVLRRSSQFTWLPGRGTAEERSMRKEEKEKKKKGLNM